MVCQDETQSQHKKRPQGNIFFPINDDEIIVFAVEAQHVNSGKLDEDIFDKDKLNRKNFSVARKRYTSLRSFCNGVMIPMLNQHKQYAGVSFTTVEKVRKIIIPDPNSKNGSFLTVFCVIDRVENGDDDGHAVICYSDSFKRLTDNQKRSTRATIHAALAKECSELTNENDITWET